MHSGFNHFVNMKKANATLDRFIQSHCGEVLTEHELEQLPRVMDYLIYRATITWPWILDRGLVEDLQQDMWFWLIQVASLYSRTTGVQFHTYAQRNLWARVISGMQYWQRRKNSEAYCSPLVINRLVGQGPCSWPNGFRVVVQRKGTHSA